MTAHTNYRGSRPGVNDGLDTVQPSSAHDGHEQRLANHAARVARELPVENNIDMPDIDHADLRRAAFDHFWAAFKSLPTAVRFARAISLSAQPITDEQAQQWAERGAA